MSPARGSRSPLDPETLLTARPPSARGSPARGGSAARSSRCSSCVAVVLAAGVGSTAGVFAYGSSCDLSSLEPVSIGRNTFVYAADGSLLGSIPAERNRQPVTAEEMSPWVRKATIAVEDRRFFEHGGVDVEGIARAAVTDLKAGRVVEGGSTITQQLVRNLYISRERTVQRKLKEACLATKLDGAWSKQRILTTYLNQVFFGNQAYGVEAAAQTYFSKSARELTLSESALLAGLTQAPSLHNPFTAPRPGARPPGGGAAGDARHRGHHAQALPEGRDARTWPAARPALQQDPRAVLLRLRPRPPDRGVRGRAGPLRGPPGVHDDRARATSGWRRTRSATR